CRLRGRAQRVRGSARRRAGVRAPRGPNGASRPGIAREIRVSHQRAAPGDGRLALGPVAPGPVRLRRPRPVPRIREAGGTRGVRDDRPGEPVLQPAGATPRRAVARGARGRCQQRLRAAEEQRVNETPEKKVAEQYPPPPTDDPPPPTFRQALVGYGSIIAALVALGVLIGVLIKVLR